MYQASTFTRKAIALAAGVIAGPGAGPFSYAAKRWGSRSEVALAMQTRALVPGGGSGTGEALAETIAADEAEFIELLGRTTLFDRTMGIQRMPARTPLVPSLSEPTGYWVGESKAIPVSSLSTTRGQLTARKVGSIVVFADDMIEDWSPEAELFVRNRLVEAVTFTLDSAFVDTTNAGSASRPAAINYDAPTFASTGDPADDVATLIGNFTGNLSRAVFYCSPRLGAQIGLRAPNGVGAACGALGGQLAGLPLMTSEASPFDSDGSTLTLVDAGAIAALDTGLEVSATKSSAIEQADDPTGASDTPTAATGSKLVSLWQTNSVAIKIVRKVSWERLSETAAVVITGCNYTATP